MNIYFGCFISNLIGLAIKDERIMGERWVDELGWYDISYRVLHVFNKSILNGWLDRFEIRLLNR
jgi:hypothetical protein